MTSSTSQTASIDSAKFEMEVASSKIKKFKMKKQIHGLVIKLNENDSLGMRLCGITIRKRILTGLLMLVAVLMAVQYSINTYVLQSIVFDTFTNPIATITSICIMSRCNTYIMVQGLQTFLVWYKLFHLFIGSVSRQIYFNFWIHWGNDSDNYNKSIIYGLKILHCLNITLGLYLVTCLDGIKTRNNKFKKILIICGLSLTAWYWIHLYFGLYHYQETTNVLVKVPSVCTCNINLF